MKIDVPCRPPVGAAGWAAQHAWESAGLACLLLILGLAAGCAHGGNAQRQFFLRDSLSAQPPALLSGAVAVLLTNHEGFTARVTLTTGSVSNRLGTTTGALAGNGRMLLFVPESGRAGDKRARSGSLSYIWDVSTNGGYILSEPLQAYAPMSAPSRFVLERADAPPPDAATETLNGHRCRREQVTVRSVGGEAKVFEIWRAEDLRGMPLKIRELAGPEGIVVTVSEVRLEAPGEELLVPPDGFTRYQNVEAMISELTVRQRVAPGRPPPRTDELPPLDQGLGQRDIGPR